MEEIYARLREIFDDVFEGGAIEVRPDLTAKDVPEWDSLSHIRLILAVQKAFKIRFTAAQTAHLANVGELVDLISAKMRMA